MEMRSTQMTIVTVLFAIVAGVENTPSPTSKPGSRIATYDQYFGAPRCQTVGAACNSFQLLNGVGKSENNAPNTIDRCPDSPFNVYYQDESIEQILVRSLDGQPMSMGQEIEYAALLYTAGNTSDRAVPNAKHHATAFYASDAFSANWQPRGTHEFSPQAGIRYLKGRLISQPGSTTQAIRFVFGSGELDSAKFPCYLRQWQDIDDIVFEVEPITSLGPSFLSSQPSTSFSPSFLYTPSPIAMASTPAPSPHQTSIATYDPSIGAPRCVKVSVECSSGDLLVGSGSFAESHKELRAPNTIDDCLGDSATWTSSKYEHDESVQQIVVRSIDGEELHVGHEAEVQITVWSAHDTTMRIDPSKQSVAHIYYASSIETEKITWKYLWSEIVEPSQGKYVFGTRFDLETSTSLAELSSLPLKVTQAIRVSYSYGQFKPNPCPPNNEGYTDVDDLAFAVSMVTPTSQPSSSHMPTSRSPRHIDTSIIAILLHLFFPMLSLII